MSILRELGDPVISLLIEFFEIYHSDVVRNSLMTYPNDANALNQRNGSLTTIGDILKILKSLKNKDRFD